MYAGACFVAGASEPARASLPPPPHGKKACVKIRANHNKHYVPVHIKSVNAPTRKKLVKIPAYHNTHYVTVHNIAVDEEPAYGGDTRHR